MLTVNKKNISFVRGDTVNLVFDITDLNGKPYIVPILQAQDLNNQNIGIYIGFVIKTNTEEKIVYENYLDIKASYIPTRSFTISGGVMTDYSAVFMSDATFCNIESQTIQHFDSYTSAYSYINSNRRRVVSTKYNNETMFWFVPNKSGAVKYCEYKFNIGFQLNPDDTSNLDTQKYVYDVALYIGEKREPTEDNGFPLSNIAFKQTLLSRHTLIVEDNVNG